MTDRDLSSATKDDEQMRKLMRNEHEKHIDQADKTAPKQAAVQHEPTRNRERERERSVNQLTAHTPIMMRDLCWCDKSRRTRQTTKR